MVVVYNTSSVPSNKKGGRRESSLRHPSSIRLTFEREEEKRIGEQRPNRPAVVDERRKKEREMKGKRLSTRLVSPAEEEGKRRKKRRARETALCHRTDCGRGGGGKEEKPKRLSDSHARTEQETGEKKRAVRVPGPIYSANRYPVGREEEGSLLAPHSSAWTSGKKREKEDAPLTTQRHRTSFPRRLPGSAIEK